MKSHLYFRRSSRSASCAVGPLALISLAWLLLMLQRIVGRSAVHFDGRDSNKDEFVTAGGVSWSGIDPKTLESRHVSQLFFAGELMDLDGITGGHNFQVRHTVICILAWVAC
jgi:predicted flavoprotein YhiN